MTNEANVFQWLPCPVVFVATSNGTTRDIMTATAMFVSEKEPLLTVSVATDHLTARLIHETETFTLIVASEDQKDLVLKLGSVKGGAEDKYDRFSIETLPSESGQPLVPKGAAAWMACKVVGIHDIAGYHVVTARVAAQEDLGRRPLIWQRDRFSKLQPL